MRRFAVWVGRAVLGIGAALGLGVLAVLVFPLGCPIARRLPDTVENETCTKRENFIETRYEVTADLTRAEMDAFLTELQSDLTQGEWEVNRREPNWVSAKYHTALVILGVTWLDGDMMAEWIAM